MAAKLLAPGALTQNEERFHPTRNELTAYVVLVDIRPMARSLKLEIKSSCAAAASGRT